MCLALLQFKVQFRGGLGLPSPHHHPPQLCYSLNKVLLSRYFEDADISSKRFELTPHRRDAIHYVFAIIKLMQIVKAISSNAAAFKERIKFE